MHGAGKRWYTKPNAPRVCARPAKNMVRVGKLRLGSRIPVVCAHYQLLPAAGSITTHMKHIVFWIIVVLVAAWIGLYI